jgi:hypothetical protein
MAKAGATKPSNKKMSLIALSGEKTSLETRAS